MLLFFSNTDTASDKIHIHQKQNYQSLSRLNYQIHLYFKDYLNQLMS